MPAPGSPGRPRRWFSRFLYRLVRPRWTDLLLLLPTLVAVLTVEYAYTGTAIPPGPDSGHWVTTSYAYLGLPHPSDFTDQPFTYPPMTFVVVGFAYLVTQSSIDAARLSVALLLVLYGLTTFHLARRFVKTPSGQLLFVGVAVLNGPTIQMLFWGGFPNFLGFSMINEGMVFLLAFLTTEGFWEGFTFWGFATLLYLTHDLSFAIFAGAVVLVVLLWVVRLGMSFFRILVNRGMWAGAALFVGAVLADHVAGDLVGATHPDYLFANPAAFQLENLGLVFRIFHFAPAIGPPGPQIVLDPAVAAAVLLGLFGVLAVAFGAITLWKPGALSLPISVSGAWLGATFAVPAAGYLAHIDTDYARFAYFFAVPVTLLLVLLAEWLLPLWAARRRAAEASAGTTARAGAFGTREIDRIAAVSIVLVILFVTASVPSAIRGETAYEISSHDPAFEQAAKWIKAQPGGGNVLTEAYASRWVEAFTARSAFASGATWIHFYPQQILDDDLSYWALTGHYVATDGHAAFVFSGYNDTENDAFPEFVGYDEGVAFPMVRVAESTLSVGYRAPNGTFVNDTYSAAWGRPTFSLAPAASTITARFAEPFFALNETVSLDGSGDGTVAFFALPSNGARLSGLSFQLAPPVPSTIARTVPFDALSYPGGGSPGFGWSVRGPLGPLPGTVTETIQGSFSMSPSAAGSFASPPLQPSRLTFAFPSSGSGIAVELRLGGASFQNPAVHLPSAFDAGAFLAENDIRFLLVQNTTGEAGAASLFEGEYGFSVGFENPEWLVLER